MNVQPLKENVHEIAGSNKRSGERKPKIRISHQRKLDIVSIALLSVAEFAVMYVLLGFAKYGINAPYGYASTDSKLVYNNIKTILDNGWIWFNEYTGAPYGSPLVDLPLWSTPVEFLITKILALFLGNNMIVIANVQFLLVFSIAAVTAFIVLRTIRTDRNIALLGAFLFSTAPYIAVRGTGHFYLTTCYFIPLSVLLCVWAYDKGDRRYLKLGKGFFRYGKNWAAIISALLIGGNGGGGYYPFFTCFFLSAVGVFCLLRERKLDSARKAAISVGLVAASYLMALSPYIGYQIIHGYNAGVLRYLATVERCGLKITQFFIPVNDHGVPMLKRLINEYNQAMPLVNENMSAYLGVAGIVGFLISLFLLLAPKREENNEEKLNMSLLSRLNLAAVLFGTIGGFSSLFALATGFYFIRCWNRISIFICFISICVLCVYLQRWKKWANGHKLRNGVMICVLVCFAGVCAWDQLPTYGARDAMLATNQRDYDIDQHFVENIEAQLKEGDMVYQLPYHVYMESGSVNKMDDYQLFVGYFHSKTLKWSYGGVRGRESDQWNARVDTLPMDMKIKVLIGAGFRGIYIDTRAYTADELAALRGSIESIIQEKPAVSENGNLMFYNLYPYIEIHPDFLEYDELTYELGRKCYLTESDNTGSYYFTDGLTGAGSYTWTLGNEAHMKVRLAEDPADDLILTFDIFRTFNGSQRVIAMCGDNEVCRETVMETDKALNIRIPKEMVTDRILNLTLCFPDAISPKTLGQSTDYRDIALGLTAFTIDYAYKPGDKVVLNLENRGNTRYFVTGLAGPEAGFTWTSGKKAEMVIPLTAGVEGELILNLYLSKVYKAPQRLVVYGNGQTIYDGAVESADEPISIQIPSGCIEDSALHLSFELPDAVSPKSQGEGEDSRELALALSGFSLEKQ